MITQKLRLKKGWSQQQLAQISGTSLRTIQRIEAGATPSLETLKSLAAVFEVSIEDLQGEPDMTAVENTVSHQEAWAMKQVNQLREFFIHVAVYLVVCTTALAALLFLSPDNLWAGVLLWLVWGAGLLIHAAKTFLLGGSWQRRQVERKLGRPL
jgi:transcriptional regulator with XRE-family HTH domain